MKRFALLSVLALSLSACGMPVGPNGSGDMTPPAPPVMPSEEPTAMPTAMPSAEPSAMPSAEPSTAPTVQDIVDTAMAAGSFDTLAQALTAAELVTTLKGEGPFTVFAPTDEAFAKIPQADLDALLADKEKLTKVLTYHVVAGNVPSSAVTGMTEATTVEGNKIAISVVDGMVKLNGNTTVTAVDVAASNGVIHVIDTVLMPPNL
jgi:uncharacterized surface protein with fasciclin (FAS1) repeats